MSQKETKAEQNKKKKKLRPNVRQGDIKLTSIHKNCLHKMSTVIKLFGFEKSSETLW